MNQVVQPPDQHYYLIELLGYDYVISYKPGKTNKVAHALSRNDPIATSQLLFLSNLTLDSLQLKENNTLIICRIYIRSYNNPMSLIGLSSS